MAICKTLLVRAYQVLGEDGSIMLKVPFKGVDVMMTDRELAEKIAAVDMGGTLDDSQPNYRNKVHVKIQCTQFATRCLLKAGFELFCWSY